MLTDAMQLQPMACAALRPPAHLHGRRGRIAAIPLALLVVSLPAQAQNAMAAALAGEAGAGAPDAVFQAYDSAERSHSAAHMGSSYVPLDSWMYGTFDRLQAMGYLPDGSSNFRPWSRIECARLLRQAHAVAERERTGAWSPSMPPPLCWPRSAASWPSKVSCWTEKEISASNRTASMRDIRELREPLCAPCYFRKRKILGSFPSRPRLSDGP